MYKSIMTLKKKEQVFYLDPTSEILMYFLLCPPLQEMLWYKADALCIV